jgi:hypothetical protein
MIENWRCSAKTLGGRFLKGRAETETPAVKNKLSKKSKKTLQGFIYFKPSKKREAFASLFLVKFRRVKFV